MSATTGPGRSGAGAWVAAITAVTLGTVAMVGFMVGNHRWDGQVILSISGAHGVHRLDVLGLAPFTAGIVLAWWRLRRGPGD